MELVKLGEKTYCIKNRTNIGIYLEDDNNIWLIDTGNDDDTAKAILKITDDTTGTVYALGVSNGELYIREV